MVVDNLPNTSGRHWQEFSISKNLVRISNENSRSITRNSFLFLVPFPKFKIWQSKFSISSRSTRYRRYKSQSRLEARDIEDTNLDLVSNNEIIKISISSRKKTRLLFIFFCWNLLCNNFEASVLFLPLPYGIHIRDGHADAERLPIRKMRRYEIRHMSDISDISESMRIAKNIRMAIPNSDALQQRYLVKRSICQKNRFHVKKISRWRRWNGATLGPFEIFP